MKQVEDYGQGIRTLRLKENIIQVIEESEQEEGNEFKRSSSQLNSEVLDIPQKEED